MTSERSALGLQDLNEQGPIPISTSVNHEKTFQFFLSAEGTMYLCRYTLMN